MGPVTAWEVDYGPGDRTYIPEAALRQLEVQTKTMEDRIAQGQFGRPDDLQRRMTFEKLKGSLSEFIYSMDAAEIDFLEYQFKPVLKFVESPNERLLLADEVGLGKTIEAALIWLELQARRDAKRLLVVCPKMLVRNWRSELRGKFNVPIEQCTVEQLGSHLADLRQSGGSHRFALIATYSSLRAMREDFRELEDGGRLSPKGKLVQAWDAWEEDYPFADLVIFDEAHTLRNPGALVSRTMRALANAVEGLLCVSATPVNNRSEDLRTLLRLLDPGVFDSEFVFNQLLAANEPAVRLGNALALLPPRLDVARSALSELRVSPLIGKSELLPRLEEILQADDAQHHEKLIEAQRLAEQLNVLGRYVARTRRRQVAELRAKRQPMVVAVEFSAMETKFYWAITRLVRQRAERAGSRFSAFHLVGPQLRMASCIPAMVDAYRQGHLGDFEDVLFDAFGDDEFNLDVEDEEESRIEFEEFLLEYRAYDFEVNDSKYAKLREALVERLPNEKIVIFSFFRGTLSYLRRRLDAHGIQTAMIHGGITKQEERDAEIERFAQPEGPRVLLSSEVGSEGINLQFARVVVNYDLPWNPMRVEQRIGRIDRVGQQAAILHVVHFKIRNTIEERLYDRLHQKLELFRNSLGDLEAVIGEEVEKLTSDLFRSQLTPKEEEERITHTEQVSARRLKAQEDLEQSGQNLLGLSDYIRDRINLNRQLGRFVSPQELKSYLEDFFRRKYRGCRLSWDNPTEKVLQLELTREAHEALNARLDETKQEAVPEQRARKIIGTLHAENCCVPIAYADGSRVEAALHEALCAARAAAGSAGVEAPTLAQIEAALNDAALRSGAHDYCYTYPETSANLQCYLKSRARQPGLYLFMDVGAGTVDLSFFQLMSDEGDEAPVRYYHASVLDAGSSRLELKTVKIEPSLSLAEVVAFKESTRRSAPEKLMRAFARACLEIHNEVGKGVGDGVVVTEAKLHPEREAQLRQMRRVQLMFAGGGFSPNPYELAARFFQKARQWETKAPMHPLPQPDDIEWSRGAKRVPFARLSVAYGLSFARYELDGQRFPGETTVNRNAPPRPRRLEVVAPSKDDV